MLGREEGEGRGVRDEEGEGRRVVLSRAFMQPQHFTNKMMHHAQCNGMV